MSGGNSKKTGRKMQPSCNYHWNREAPLKGAQLMPPAMRGDSLLHKIPHWINESAETIMLFFSCLVLLVVIEKIYKKHSHYRNIKKGFRLLTPPEKAILKLYISQNTNSLSLDIMDAVLAGLVTKGFILRSTTMSYSTHYGHTIQPWAWEYMQKHKEEFAK